MKFFAYFGTDTFEGIQYIIVGAILGFIIIKVLAYINHLRLCANLPKHIYKDSNRKNKVMEELQKEKYNLPFINDEVNLKDWVKRNKKKTILAGVILFLILMGFLG